MEETSVKFLLRKLKKIKLGKTNKNGESIKIN